jgi:predicted regulator of Ras-like GTPase activity (Roadblock/LC7/MglB family)
MEGRHGMSELARLLDSFCKIEGVKGAILLNQNGELIEKTVAGDVNLENLESFLFQSTKIGIDAAVELQKEKLNQSYLEFEDMSFTSILLANDFILTIISSSGVNLGRIRLEIRKNKKAIETLME